MDADRGCCLVAPAARAEAEEGVVGTAMEDPAGTALLPAGGKMAPAGALAAAGSALMLLLLLLKLLLLVSMVGWGAFRLKRDAALVLVLLLLLLLEARRRGPNERKRAEHLGRACVRVCGVWCVCGG